MTFLKNSYLQPLNALDTSTHLWIFLLSINIRTSWTFSNDSIIFPFFQCFYLVFIIIFLLILILLIFIHCFLRFEFIVQFEALIKCVSLQLKTFLRIRIIIVRLRSEFEYQNEQDYKSTRWCWEALFTARINLSSKHSVRWMNSYLLFWKAERF
jgi:c-di-AMP phosphodiesterase-like protein